MSELAHFQNRFLAAISVEVFPADAMLIYRNTALLGAIEALSDNFPVTRAIVGDEAFAALARLHAAGFPPETPVLAEHGRHFAAWLGGQPIAQELPYLADVARCERMWIETLHAADARALGLQELARFDPEELLTLRFGLHPATRFAWQQTPAIEIWLAHQDEQVDEIVADWRPCGALFTRPDIAVLARAIDAPAHRLLCGLRLGEPLGVAARAAVALYPATDIGTCFAGLVRSGALAALANERRVP